MLNTFSLFKERVIT